MKNEGIAGIDEDESVVTEQEKVTSFEEAKKKRKPFALWKVADEDYRLKLRSDMVCKLEDKYRTNILNLITGEGLPPLAIMLTVIQAAMCTYNHGIKLKDVQAIYETYLDEGGSQIQLLTDVIFPILSVSGFFTESQSQELLEKVKEMDDQI